MIYSQNTSFYFQKKLYVSKFLYDFANAKVTSMILFSLTYLNFRHS